MLPVSLSQIHPWMSPSLKAGQSNDLPKAQSDRELGEEGIACYIFSNLSMFTHGMHGIMRKTAASMQMPDLIVRLLPCRRPR
jgi:hypothetical protein